MKAEMFIESVIRSRAEVDVDIEVDRSRTEPHIFGDPPGTARRPPIDMAPPLLAPINDSGRVTSNSRSTLKRHVLIPSATLDRMHPGL